MEFLTDDIGLSAQQIEQIRSVFKKYEPIKEAIIYGSRAKGNFRPGSDVDLCLKGANLNQKVLFKIETDLEETLLPFTFDISAYHHLDNKELIEHIDRMGKIFYLNRTT